MKKEDIKLFMNSTKTGEAELVKWSTSEKAMHVKIAKRIKEKAMDKFEYIYKGKTTGLDSMEVLAKFVKEVYVMDAETEEQKAEIAGTILSNKKSHVLKCAKCGNFFDSMNKLKLTGSNGLQGVSECPKCGYKVGVIKTDQAPGYVTSADGSLRRVKEKKLSNKARKRAKK